MVDISYPNPEGYGMSRFDSCIWSDAGDAPVEEHRPRKAAQVGSTPIIGSAGRVVLVSSKAHNLALARCNTGPCIHLRFHQGVA